MFSSMYSCNPVIFTIFGMSCIYIIIIPWHVSLQCLDSLSHYLSLVRHKQQLDLSLYVYFHVHVMHSTGNGVTASREDAVFIPEYLPLHVSVMFSIIYWQYIPFSLQISLVYFYIMWSITPSLYIMYCPKGFKHELATICNLRKGCLARPIQRHIYKSTHHEITKSRIYMLYIYKYIYIYIYIYINNPPYHWNI